MSTNVFEWPAFTTLVDAANSVTPPERTPATGLPAGEAPRPTSVHTHTHQRGSPVAAASGPASCSGTTMPSGRTSPHSSSMSAHSNSAAEHFAPTEASPSGMSGSTDARQRRTEVADTASPNLFVAELPPSVDDEALEAAFRVFGPVVSAKVMLDVNTAVSRGFGFVLFENGADAAAARDALQGQPVPGHGGKLQISVSRHRGENLTAQSRVVYVRNVPVAVGRPRLEAYLQRFGRVAKLQVKGSASGAAGVANAVIEFAQPESARAAVAALHGKRPFEPECAVPLLAKLEEPRKLRDQRLLHVAQDADQVAPREPTPAGDGTTAPVPRAKDCSAKPVESETLRPAARDPLRALVPSMPTTRLSSENLVPTTGSASATAALPPLMMPPGATFGEALLPSTAHLATYASPHLLGASVGSVPGYYCCYYPPPMNMVPVGGTQSYPHGFPPVLGYHHPSPVPAPPQGYYYASAPPALVAPPMSYVFYTP